MLTISDIAAKHLESWLDDLMWGRLQLWQLPSPVRGFFDLGFHEGTQISTSALTEKIERLEHECDRLFLAAFSPKQKRDLLLQRHAERDPFEWELFESALLQIINSKRLEDATPVAIDGANINESQLALQRRTHHAQALHRTADAA